MKNVPLRRLGQPEEVACTIYYLCTPESSYVPGVEIEINGGQHVCEVGWAETMLVKSSQLQSVYVRCMCDNLCEYNKPWIPDPTDVIKCRVYLLA